DLAHYACEGGLGVARLVAHESLLRIEPALEELRNRGARYFAGLARIPNDRQRLKRLMSAPIAVCDHRNPGIADLHHLLDAGHAGDLGRVEAFDLAGAHRRILDGGDEHAGHLDVDAVDLLAGELVGGVEPLEALAGDLPVLGVLELDVL